MDKDAEYFGGVKWPVDSSDKVELRLGWRSDRMISCANPVSEVWMGEPLWLAERVADCLEPVLEGPSFCRLRLSAVEVGCRGCRI